MWFDKMFSFIGSEFLNFHFQWLFHCPYVSNSGNRSSQSFFCNKPWYQHWHSK